MPHNKKVDELLNRLLTENGKVVQIRPIATELSLAFNPKTRKHFFMRKDGKMPNFIEILKDQKPLPSQDKILSILKDAKVSDEGQEVVFAALRLLESQKDSLPKEFISKIAKDLGVDNLLEAIQKVDVEAIKKDEREKILEELKKDKEDGYVLLKSQLEKMEKDLSTSNKRLEEAEVRLMTVQDERDIMAIKKDLKDLNVPGDLDEIARTAHSITKINKDLGEQFLKQQKSMAGIIKTFGIEHELGRSGDGVPSDAMAKLNELTREKMAKDGTDYSDAYAAVTKEHPDLFRTYIKEAKKL